MIIVRSYVRFEISRSRLDHRSPPGVTGDLAVASMTMEVVSIQAASLLFRIPPVVCVVGNRYVLYGWMDGIIGWNNRRIPGDAPCPGPWIVVHKPSCSMLLLSDE